MSLPIVTQASAGGGDLTPYLLIPAVGATVGAWPGANQGIFVKFRVNKPRTVTGLRFGVGAASGNAKVALYTNDGTTLTQIALSASTAVAGASAPQDILFTASQTVYPNQDYCAYLTLDNGTATILRSLFGSGAFVAHSGFDLAYAVTTAFVTPPTPQLISGTTTAASGYTPILALI